MDRIRHVNHKGKAIIIFDFSNMTPGKEANDLFERSIIECQGHPVDSILSITDVTGAKYDRETLEGMKRFSDQSKRFTKKSAVVGVKGMIKAGYLIVMSFSKRSLPVFDTVDEALDWLVKD